MKRAFYILLTFLLIATYCMFAMASTSSDDTTENQGEEKVEANADDKNGDQGNDDVDKKEEDNSNLGDYNIVIKGSRLVKSYDGSDAIIITYSFTNNSDEAAAFIFTFDDNAYQDGIGLNEAYILDDSANYSADNQTKEIKPGATLDVEVAYALNDVTTDVEVEVKEIFSFNDKTITKTFNIS